tara:strand:+ start:3682 stop:4098 length:417 start_codon:yes stop_codon:yes gene_type:complete
MQYQGLCIGGPLDGTLLACADTIYTYKGLPPLDRMIYREQGEPEKLDEDDGRLAYYYTDSVFHCLDTTRRMGFWVLKGATILDAFDALFARYQEERKENDLLQRALDSLRRSTPDWSNETAMSRHRQTIEELTALLEK